MLLVGISKRSFLVPRLFSGEAASVSAFDGQGLVLNNAISETRLIAQRDPDEYHTLQMEIITQKRYPSSLAT